MKASPTRRPRTQHRPSRRTTKSTENTPFSAYLPRLLRAMALAVPVTLATALLLALIGAGVLSALPDPDTSLLPLGLSILLLSALLMGLVIGKRTGDRLLPGGLLGGLLLLGIMYVLSFPFAHREGVALPGALALPLRGAVRLFCLLGSYLGGHFPSRAPIRRNTGRK